MKLEIHYSLKTSICATRYMKVWDVPGSATLASYHCAPMTVSIESAIRSRDCSEKLMPDVPIEMPSLTPERTPGSDGGQGVKRWQGDYTQHHESSSCIPTPFSCLLGSLISHSL